METTKVNTLLVNQLTAQIKLTEVWKAVNDNQHPLKIQSINHENDLCAEIVETTFRSRFRFRF